MPKLFCNFFVCGAQQKLYSKAYASMWFQIERWTHLLITPSFTYFTISYALQASRILPLTTDHYFTVREGMFPAAPIGYYLSPDEEHRDGQRAFGRSAASKTRMTRRSICSWGVSYRTRTTGDTWEGRVLPTSAEVPPDQRYTAGGSPA